MYVNLKMKIQAVSSIFLTTKREVLQQLSKIKRLFLTKLPTILLENFPTMRDTFTQTLTVIRVTRME